MTFRVKHRVSCETHTDETVDALRVRLANEGIRVSVQAEGKRQLIRHNGKLCSRCRSNPPLAKQRYCKSRHADASREYRARLKERYAIMCAKVAAYEGAPT